MIARVPAGRFMGSKIFRLPSFVRTRCMAFSFERTACKYPDDARDAIGGIQSMRMTRTLRIDGRCERRDPKLSANFPAGPRDKCSYMSIKLSRFGYNNYRPLPGLTKVAIPAPRSKPDRQTELALAQKKDHHHRAAAGGEVLVKDK